MLTIQMQAQGINPKIMVSLQKAVTTLDLGVYKPAKQLQMAHQDIGNLILQPGESL